MSPEEQENSKVRIPSPLRPVITDNRPTAATTTAVYHHAYTA